MNRYSDARPSAPKLVLGVVLALLVASLAACKVYQTQGPTQTTSNPLTPVCHGGKTVRVDDKMVREHLNHGDTLGTCPD